MDDAPLGEAEEVHARDLDARPGRRRAEELAIVARGDEEACRDLVALGDQLLHREAALVGNPRYQVSTKR